MKPPYFISVFVEIAGKPWPGLLKSGLTQSIAQTQQCPPKALMGFFI
jgi:hypothetical protein